MLNGYNYFQFLNKSLSDNALFLYVDNLLETDEMIRIVNSWRNEIENDIILTVPSNLSQKETIKIKKICLETNIRCLEIFESAIAKPWHVPVSFRIPSLVQKIIIFCKDNNIKNFSFFLLSSCVVLEELDSEFLNQDTGVNHYIRPSQPFNDFLVTKNLLASGYHSVNSAYIGEGLYDIMFERHFLNASMSQGYTTKIGEYLLRNDIKFTTDHNMELYPGSKRFKGLMNRPKDNQESKLNNIFTFMLPKLPTNNDIINELIFFPPNNYPICEESIKPLIRLVRVLNRWWDRIH